MCGPPMSGRFTTPMTHTLLDSRRVASPAEDRFAQHVASKTGRKVGDFGKESGNWLDPGRAPGVPAALLELSSGSIVI